MEKKFERISREVVYRSKWVNLFADKVIAPNGTLIERYHIVDFEYAAVGCVVTNERNEVLLVKAYRYPTGTHGWEIPAGMVDPGESAIAAAAREVFEESGYHIHNLSEIHRYYPMNGISNKEYVIVCGELDAEFEKLPSFDESEVSECAWFGLPVIEELIKRNEIKCGLTLTALLLHMRD
ncbi:MAG: NUDIX hydrolase [Bacillota bacterium]